MEVDGCWCAPRSSKPVQVVNSCPGGFDSHISPPNLDAGDKGFFLCPLCLWKNNLLKFSEKRVSYHENFAVIYLKIMSCKARCVSGFLQCKTRCMTKFSKLPCKRFVDSLTQAEATFLSRLVSNCTKIVFHFGEKGERKKQVDFSDAFLFNRVDERKIAYQLE